MFNLVRLLTNLVIGLQLDLFPQCTHSQRRAQGEAWKAQFLNDLLMHT